MYFYDLKLFATEKKKKKKMYMLDKCTSVKPENPTFSFFLFFFALSSEYFPNLDLW